MEIDAKEASDLYNKMYEMVTGRNSFTVAVVIHMLLADILLDPDYEFEDNQFRTRFRRKGTYEWIEITTDAQIERLN